LVILDRPGLGISDITTTNSKAFAVLTRNTMPNPLDIKWNEGGMSIITVEQLEEELNTDPNNIARGIHYNFFSNLSSDLQQHLKTTPVSVPSGDTPYQAFLLAETDNSSNNFSQLGISSNTAIGHDSFIENSTHQIWSTFYSKDISINNNVFTGATIDYDNTSQIGSGEISFFHTGTREIGSTENSISKVGIIGNRVAEMDISQIAPFKVSIADARRLEANILQIGSTEIDFIQGAFGQIRPSDVDTSQVGSFERNISLNTTFQIDPWKVSLSRSITPQQLTGSFNLFDSHNPNLQNTTVATWTEFLQSPTPFNLKIEIADLPTGQLAEGTITGYDTNNRPNSGTLTLDTDGNSLGWFIDTTPDDNSEFDQNLTTTAFRATTGAAAGKYDLLTTVLHELGHLQGIISGNTAFDTHVQNINGIPTFINGGITAQLTPDGSHLDSTLYPYDLMNTSLKPGVRKLPSGLDLSILKAINAGIGNRESGVVGAVNSANLTAGALIGITNGDFTTPTTWNTEGETNIINGSATLTEQSQKLSELTQAFIIPTGAKTLQFTIKDNHLITGDTTKTANDAFEVALLDTNTFNPLAGTSIGLTNTDSLLNIQANGTIHKSDKVTITALTNNSSIVTIDLTQITPTTQATLYFNLLGFGARTSTVTIDDVKLFTDTQPIPVTTNDTLTTNQNTPLTLDPTQLTTNDTNVSQIQIINQPTHGTLTQTLDGKLTYQPIPTYVGNDSFTYLGYGSDGQISNLATVNLTVNNLLPTIQTLTIPTTIAEGQNIQLSALAKDGGTSDNLTYTWNLGDGSNPITGQNIAHTYTDNGNYAVTLTVTDKDGGSTQQTTTVKVDNLAPIVNLTAPTTTLNQGESLNLGVTYSDPGTKDTHTITWNFDDGSTPVTLTPSSSAPQPNLQPHTFIKAGNHNVTVTITDNDGAITTKAIQIAVTNIAPTTTNLDIPTNINEGQSVTLTATATDPGNDTLTYNWYLNNATIPITGQTINYAFADNGIYPVKLDVIDSNGAITTQSLNVTVNNIAPEIVAIVKPDKIDEGQPVQFTATATDPGINDTLTYSWNFGDNTTPVRVGSIS
jgi:PKD repeat protein